MKGWSFRGGGLAGRNTGEAEPSCYKYGSHGRRSWLAWWKIEFKLEDWGGWGRVEGLRTVILLPRQRRVKGRCCGVHSPQSEMTSKDDGSRPRSISTSCNCKERTVEVREVVKSCGVWQGWSWQEWWHNFAFSFGFLCHFDFVMVCVFTWISSNSIHSRDKTRRKCFVINLIRNE